MNKLLTYLLVTFFVAFGMENSLEDKVKDLTTKIEANKDQFTLVHNEISKYKELPSDNFFLYSSSGNKYHESYLAIVKKGSEGYAIIDIKPKSKLGIDEYYKELKVKDEGDALKIIRNTLEKTVSKNGNKIIFNEFDKEKMDSLYLKILKEVEAETE